MFVDNSCCLTLTLVSVTVGRVQFVPREKRLSAMIAMKTSGRVQPIEQRPLFRLEITWTLLRHPNYIPVSQSGTSVCLVNNLHKYYFTPGLFAYQHKLVRMFR